MGKFGGGSISPATASSFASANPLDVSSTSAALKMINTQIWATTGFVCQFRRILEIIGSVRVTLFLNTSKLLWKTSLVDKSQGDNYTLPSESTTNPANLVSAISNMGEIPG